MSTLQNTRTRRPKGHLLIAAALLLLGGITTQWIIEDFPDPRRRPRSNLTQGELLSSAASSPAAGSIRGDQGLVLEGASDYASITFDLLGSFYYETPELDAPKGPDGVPVVKNQIPTPIRSLNKKRIAVQGFMFPITRERDRVRTFLLVKDRSLCCFGRTPRMNDKIYVRMRKGRSAPYIMDQIITVFGVLEVGEAYDKNGQLRSIYNLEADNAAPAPGL